MSTGATAASMDVETSNPTPKGRSLWTDAYYRLKKDKWAIVSFVIMVIYSMIAIAAKAGWIATPWDRVVGPSYAPPSLKSMPLWLGTDIFGRSVLYKTIHGTRIAMSVGLVTAVLSTPVGIILGMLAGYFGGVIDETITWFYTTLSSIPNLILLLAITYSLGKGLTAIYVALGATAWVGLARVIRGEVIKHKEREYVIAADSLGATHLSRMFKHILPNIFHFVIINLSFQFMGAIKSEVILSFLGLGVQGEPSWGVMIDDAKLELARGVWWQLTGATVAMFFVVLALNVLGDSLRDALDPKIK